MDKETLFTASKWEILRALSTGKKSPSELAEASRTSVANISQQLRLLELAGFITSERLANREKGQPRLLYSLAGNYSFLIVSAPGFVEKKFISFDERQKATLRTWFLDNQGVRYGIEKALWHLDEKLANLKAIALNQTITSSISLLLISDQSAELKKSLKPLTVKKDGITRTITFTIKTEKELAAYTAKLYPLYDPYALVSSGGKADQG